MYQVDHNHYILINIIQITIKWRLYRIGHECGISVGLGAQNSVIRVRPRDRFQPLQRSSSGGHRTCARVGASPGSAPQRRQSAAELQPRARAAAGVAAQSFYAPRCATV